MSAFHTSSVEWSGAHTGVLGVGEEIDVVGRLRSAAGFEESHQRYQIRRLSRASLVSGGV
jgi:hypothetical protein